MGSRTIRFTLCLIVLSVICKADAQTSGISLVPVVDQRVELLSIVFRLAGNFEYNMSPLKSYTADIDSYFSPHKNHPAVLRARSLAEKNGVYFDAVMNMAICLTNPPDLKPAVPFTDKIPESRWGKDNATEFVPLLQDFYRDTHFEKFFNAHQPLYQLTENRFQTGLTALDLNWYKEFYGDLPTRARYNLILGMNNGGGSYGPRLVFPDGREELFSILGVWRIDNAGNPTFSTGDLDTVIHEFNHSFINPVLDAHRKDFSSAGEVYKQVSTRMQQLAYGNSETMVKESLVRAAVFMYLESRGHSNGEIQQKIRREQANGFIWIDEIYDLLHEYASQRSRYPTFDSFMPVIAKFYRELPSRFARLKTKFDGECVHVTGIQPFANHAHDVSPDLQQIVITFDKPLVPGNASINDGPDGKEQNPIKGKPEFLAGNQSIKLPITLKPSSQYGFTLTGMAFGTPDGFPLESYVVEFQTAQAK